MAVNFSHIDPETHAVAKALAYLEGAVGASIMLLFFLLATLFAVSGLWRIGAKRIAVAEVFLVIATIISVIHVLSHSPTDSISISIALAMLSAAVVAPLSAAIVCLRKGLRRQAFATIVFVVLGLIMFAVRASVAFLCFDYGEVCTEEGGECIN